MLTLLALAILIFCYQFVFTPGRRQLRSLRETLARKNQDLKTLEKLCQEYRQRTAQEKLSPSSYAAESFSLIGFLGQLVNAAGLKDNVREVKPLPALSRQEAIVERLRVSLEEVSLETVCRLLREIEQPGFIYVANFQMKRHREKPFWVNVEMELFVLKKAAPVSR